MTIHIALEGGSFGPWVSSRLTFGRGVQPRSWTGDQVSGGKCGVGAAQGKRHDPASMMVQEGVTQDSGVRPTKANLEGPGRIDTGKPTLGLDERGTKC
jgi:hypothetical protein